MNRKKFVSAISIICLVGLITIISISAVLSRETIYKNVYVESVNVGGLSREDANERLVNVYQNELASVEISLIYNERDWAIRPEEINYTYLYDKAIEEAYNIGRDRGWAASLREIFSLRKRPIVISLERVYDESLLDDLIREISLEINKEPIKASIRRINNDFEIVDEVPGIMVDEALTKHNLLLSLEILENREIEVSVNINMPNVTKDILSHINHMVSEFKTSFNPEIVGRVRNIEVAAGKINGTLLMPMEVFSFNEITGSRNKAEGYHEAPIIVNGKFVPGIGGGVCQVSTTLYNAVVRSDLKIVERRNHSLPVGYVPLGQDATVADNYIDFKFENNNNFPIYIQSYVQGDSLYIRIFGKKGEDMLIELHSQITEVISPKIEVKKDPDMVIGERKIVKEAKQGYRVDTYKVYFKSGLQVKREHISRDYYTPVPGEIIEGTKIVERDEQPTTEEVIINESEAIE